MTEVPPTVTAASAMRQLVEWSESIPLPLWQRDALRRLYSSCPLSATDEEEVFSICKSLHSLLGDGETALPPKSISVADIPATSTTTSAVTMSSVSDVVHVNALADNQKMLFGSLGLTVVFGNNGSGKSGYARILKTVCRARSSEDILHNVYDKKPTVPASARLLFSIGGTQQPVFEWKAGVPAAPALSLVSVFDSKCAPIHVDEKNEAAFTPLPLQVIKELSDICRRFKTKLQNISTALAGQIPVALREIKCSRETKAGKFLHGITATSSHDEAARLAELSAAEVARVEELKLQLQADSQKTIATEESRRTRLTALVQRIERLATALSQTAVDSYRDVLETARVKAEAARIAATEAFTNEPLDGIGSPTWKALWEAARQYSETAAYPATSFPKTDDALCVLCQQSLEPDAVARFGRFEAFVRQNSQRASADATAAVNKARQTIEVAVISDEQVEQDINFVRDELADSDSATALKSFYDSVAARRNALLKAEVDAAWTPPSALVAGPATTLQAVSTQIGVRIEELRKVENPEARAKLKVELQELEDRAFLQSVLDDVRVEIDRRKKTRSRRYSSRRDRHEQDYPQEYRTR